MNLAEYQSHEDEHDDDSDVGHHGGHGSGPHEEHEEGEPWLVSYADMMTLLFGFFVLMYSFAKAELKDDMVNVRKEVAKYFGGDVSSPFEDVKKDLETELQRIGMKDLVETKLSPEGLEIEFTSTVLFDSGKADILPHAKDALKILTGHLLEKAEYRYGVRVEGHTDDNPILQSPKYDTNWELSGARAASVVRTFEGAGFHKADLLAVGHGDSRPKLPNRDNDGKAIVANQTANRRVVVKIFINEILKEESPPKAGEKRGH